MSYGSPPYDRQHSRLHLGLLTVLLGQTPALAATPPYDSAAAIRGIAILPQASDAAEARELARITERSDEDAAGATATQSVRVNNIIVEGAEALDAEDLDGILAPYRQRDLTFADIQSLANRITIYSRKSGFLLAKAYVPAHAWQAGTLTLQWRPGRYGAMELTNHSPISAQTLAAILQQHSNGQEPVTQEGLERSLLLVQALPGAGLPLLTIRPGASDGRSDFSIDVPTTGRLHGILSADNYGSRFTGENRISGSVQWADPLQRGDQLSLDAMSTSVGGLWNGRLAYASPLTADGLRGEISAWRTNYALGGTYALLDAHGTADGIGAKLSYPLVLNLHNTVYLSGELADKALRDVIATPATVTDKRARTLTVEIDDACSGRWLGRAGTLAAGAGVTFGTLSLADPLQAAANHLGADTVGHYRKLDAHLSASIPLIAHWQFSGNLLTQFALDRNLDGSEQLAVSGVTGIRSYADGLTNDTGALLNLAVTHPVPTPLATQSSLRLFADYGEARARHQVTPTEQTPGISDLGIGYQFTGSHLTAEANLARTTGHSPILADYNGRWKVLASAGYRF